MCHDIHGSVRRAIGVLAITCAHTKPRTQEIGMTAARQAAALASAIESSARAPNAVLCCAIVCARVDTRALEVDATRTMFASELGKQTNNYKKQITHN